MCRSLSLLFRISKASLKAQSLFLFEKSHNFCVLHQNIILKKMVEFFNPGSIDPDVEIAPRIVGIVVLTCLSFISVTAIISPESFSYPNIHFQDDNIFAILLLILLGLLFISLYIVISRICKMTKRKTSYEEICWCNYFMEQKSYICNFHL